MARYRYRFRRYASSRTDWRVLAGAGVALAALGSGTPAAVHHFHHHAHSGWHGSVPDGSAYTPTTWGRAFLRAGHFRITDCDMNAMVAWEHAEGTMWHHITWKNPLNTTQAEPGSYRVNDLGNGIGVQAFPTWREGFQANLTALFNGYYPGIISALKAGDDAQAVADAVANSPWGTAPFSAEC